MPRFKRNFVAWIGLFSLGAANFCAYAADASERYVLSIDGSGHLLLSIDGSGFTDRSAVLSIDGSGFANRGAVLSIDGSGFANRGAVLSIDGSGFANRGAVLSIDGSGFAKSRSVQSIDGSGFANRGAVLSIDGSGFAQARQVLSSPVQVLGGLDVISSESVRVLGQDFALAPWQADAMSSAEVDLAGRFAFASGDSDGETVRLTGLYVFEGYPVPGASFLFVRGAVSDVNPSLGQISVSDLVVDITTVSLPLYQGAEISVIGIQPVHGGTFLATQSLFTDSSPLRSVSPQVASIDGSGGAVPAQRLTAKRD